MTGKLGLFSRNMSAFIPIFFLFTAYSTMSAFGHDQSFRDVVRKANPAVVYIEVYIAQTSNYLSGASKVAGSGSGVIIDSKRGVVLTAAHVVNDAVDALVQLPDGRKMEALDIRADAQTDVGIIFIEPDNLPQVDLGDSDLLEVGDWVLAMGSPFGKTLANSVSAGIVSGKGRKTQLLGGLGIEDYIQTDAVINKGNSGGPLFNIEGKVIGINSSIISSNGMSAGLGFAVPSNIIKSVVRQLIDHGVVTRGWIGARIASLSQLTGEAKLQIPQEVLVNGGVYIVEAMPNEPSARAGIQNGDIITQIEDVPVTEPSELTRMVSDLKPGESVGCVVYRNGQYLKLKIILGLRPGTGEPGSYSALTDQDRAAYSFEKLGLVLEEVQEDISGPLGTIKAHSLKIKYVKPGSIAKDFGLNTGEYILKINHDSIRSVQQFEDNLRDADLKQGVMLTIRNTNGTRKVIIKET